MEEDICNCWEIEVKVITKSKVKEYKGGKLFKLDLQDAHPWEDGKAFQIEATCFKETCDAYYDKFEEGYTYKISGASVYTANRKFTFI